MRRKSLVAAPHPVPTCDRHVAIALRQVTPADGDHGTDSNVMVRRLDVPSTVDPCRVCGRAATWVLQLVGVFR